MAAKVRIRVTQTYEIDVADATTHDQAQKIAENFRLTFCDVVCSSKEVEVLASSEPLQVFRKNSELICSPPKNGMLTHENVAAINDAVKQVGIEVGRTFGSGRIYYMTHEPKATSEQIRRINYLISNQVPDYTEVLKGSRWDNNET